MSFAHLGNLDRWSWQGRADLSTRTSASFVEGSHIMASHRSATSRGKRMRFAPRLEVMEDRQLLNATAPMFINTLDPNALALGNTSFVYQPTGTTTVTTLQSGSKPTTVPLYNVGAFQIQEDLGLKDDVNGNPILTTVYGYGTSAATATYPGRSFVVQSGQPIAVQWTNGLPTGQHLLPVDPTVLGPNLDKSGNSYYSTVTTDGVSTVTFPSGVPMVPHVHGGHTTAAYDGTPMQWMTDTGSNQQVGPDFFSNPFVYDNSQQAATLWYHDHAMGVTRLNVYAGLAGFYIIHDNNEAQLISSHTLPDERYDIPLAIQDRTFTADGQLSYPADPPTADSPDPSVQPEFFGDTILVDGKAWPVMNVEPRMYRFRILNGSQSRFYNLSLDSGQSFFQIGTDNGLLNRPVSLTSLLIAPGERADVVVDFSNMANKSLIMRNNAAAPFPVGDPENFNEKTTGQIMAFQVTLPMSNIKDVNRTLFLDTNKPLNKVDFNKVLGAATDTKVLGLFESTDEFGRLIQKLGAAVATDPGTIATIAPSNFVDSNGHYVKPETVQLIRNPNGTQSVTEEWQVYNFTADTHPMHLHSASFQIVSRQQFTGIDLGTGAFDVTALGTLTGPDANENGWKDTVRMNPGEVTTIRVKFDLAGNYVWHCHILEHEEHDMMHGLVILAAPTAAAAPAVMTGASTTAATGTGSPTAIATSTATASTLANAASQPVPLTTGSTSDQVATSTVVDPSIDLTSVPLDPNLRKKLFGY